MKGLKGMLLKKLKTIKTKGYLKPERNLQVNASDSYIHASSPTSSPAVRSPLVPIQEEEPKNRPNDDVFPVRQPEIIDVSELMKDLEDEEMESDDEMNNKENFSPEMRPESDRDSKQKSRTMRPLEAKDAETSRTELCEDEEEPPLKAQKMDPLAEYEEMCPPGGSNSIILYTTGLRGIRKTFEDCQKLRSLLENLRVMFFERDISMHSEFKEELWGILGGKIVPPRLFVKGRYIGGAEEVLGLHEQGRLKKLIEGIPVDRNDGPCEGCFGFRFILCFNCNGSRKVVPEGGFESPDCSECNENGVIVCPVCC